MIIRFEIPDEQGQEFKHKCLMCRTTMSRIIRFFIGMYVNDTLIKRINKLQELVRELENEQNKKLIDELMVGFLHLLDREGWNIEHNDNG